MIFPDDKYIAICKFDENNEICFTPEYLALTRDSGNARSFAAHLITWWEGENMQTILDYFGPEDEEMDKYSGIDGAAMNVRPDICDLMEYKDMAVPGLDSDWHQDILRSKLITIKLPERLIKEYVKAVKKANKKI